MPAKATSPTLLPADLYDLTVEDKRHLNEEQRLGMVAPQDPLLQAQAQAIDPKLIGSGHVQRIVQRLFGIAGGQQQGSVKNKARRMLVGLAAPQIGEPWRVFVADTKIDAQRKKPGKLECFINPEIIWRSRETEEGREGCFSAGPVWGLVRRPIAVKIRAFTPEGKKVERVFEGFTARIIQHEVDHLNGIRFPDRITNDRKRHWVHAEEMSLYPAHVRQWVRLCSRERWKQFTV